MTSRVRDWKPNPLVQRLRAHLDETTDLIRRMDANEREPNAALRSTRRDEQRMLISAKLNELKLVRDETRSQLAGMRSQLSGAGLGDRISSIEDFAKSVEQRFARLESALLAVSKSNASGDRSRAIRSAKDELYQLHGRIVEQETAMGDGSIPTFRIDRPVVQQPHPKSPVVPKYLSRPAIRDNAYAFFLKVALAAAPDATPPEASSCNYVAADLAENQEVQLTAEIRALAEKLEYSPAKIYQYVANEIRFEPYWGSLKGAIGALYSKSGGPTDQASLLIALLRASNVPARYVKGEIQLRDGSNLEASGRAPKWIGAKSYVASAQVLAQGRNPSVTYFTDGIKFYHVWVEACVPYANYRGARVDNTGHRWIPLDPSYKENTYQPGIAPDAQLPKFDYSGSAGTYMAARTNTLPQEKFAEQIEAWAKTQSPNFNNNAITDVPYQATATQRFVDVLPASLPYEVTQFLVWDAATNNTAEAAEVPDKHRYKFNVTVGSGSGQSVSLSLPSVALKRITLSFKGATTADQSAIDAWKNDGVMTTLCAPGTVNAIPSIKVDGTEQTLASPVSVGFCSTGNSLDLEVRIEELGTGLPGSVNHVSFSNIGAANYHALQAYAFQASDRLLSERTARLIGAVQSGGSPNAVQEETEGEFLHLTGLKYVRYISDAGKRVGAWTGQSGESGNHLGLTSAVSKIEYLFDLPFAVNRKGFLVDVPGGLSRSVDLGTGGISFDSFLLTGYAASSYESYIWQENSRLDAVSTVRGIQFARETSIPVYVFKTSPGAGEQPISAYDTLMDVSTGPYNMGGSLKTSIVNLVNAGRRVTVPRQQIQYGDWRGAVWVSELNNLAVDGSASAGFQISGGYAGGYTTGAPINQTVFDGGTGAGTVRPAETPTTIASAQPINSVTLADGVPVYSAGDPVNMATGSMYHVERDLAIKGRGGLPIVFERSYNSRNAKDGPLGFGWTHSFNHYLRFYGVESGNAKVSWVEGTGAERFFQTTSQTGGNITLGATLTNPDGIYVTFTRVSGSGNYTIKEKNGLTYEFESVNGTATDTQQRAKLLSIKDRNNNTLTLTYTLGRFAKVTDGLGREVTFNYGPDNRLSEVKDWINRSFRYDYDISGNLTTFRNPLAVAGQQNPVAYEYYSDANLIHAMKRYTLPRDNGMTFEYYANGKVFRHYNTLNETTTFTYNDFRRETVAVNERGYTRRFFFDQYGNATKIVEETGGERTYTFDIANNRPFNKIEARDPLGQLTRYDYDANGNVTKVTLPSQILAAGVNDTVEFYNITTDFNQPQRIKDARGNWTVLKYDSSGNLLEQIKLKAGASAPSIPYTPNASDLIAWTINTYDGNGNLATSKRVRDLTTQAGPVSTYTYSSTTGKVGLNLISIQRDGDKDGVLSTVESDVSPTLAYDELGRVTTGLDANWYSTTIAQYDDVDRVKRASDRFNQLRDFSYDANGNLAQQVLNVGGTIKDKASFAYDMSDRRIRAQDAGDNATTIQYDPAGNPIRVTSADNYATDLYYDELNRVVRASDEAGNAVTKSLDLNGRVRQVVDPNGNAVTFDYYDGLKNGWVKRVTQPKIQSYAQGRALEYDYDANGNAVKVSEYPADYPTTGVRETLTNFDALNRPTRVVGPVYADASLGSIRPVTLYSYNALGYLTEVKAGRTDSSGTNATSDVVVTQQTTQYDDYGRSIKTTDALGKFWASQYDINNNVTRVTDARGQVLQYTWQYGNQLQCVSKNNANPTCAANADLLIQYTRNERGQVVDIVHASPALTLHHEYGAANRLVSVNDSRGNKTLTYAYSPGGRLNSLTDTEGNVTNYQYDAVGRLAGIWAPNYDNVVFRYDPAGRLTEKWFPNGVNTQLTYNADGSLAHLINRTGFASPTADCTSVGTEVLSCHDYTYDGIGNRAGHVEGIRTPASYQALAYAYQYDSLGRLTQVDNGTAAQLNTFAYDALGNRTQRAIGNPVTQTTSYVYDLANRLTSTTGSQSLTLTHDDNGNVLTRADGSTTITLTYDELNRVATVASTGQSTQSYGYDASGRRVQRTIGTSATSWLYNGPDIYAEYGASWTAAAAIYTHGPGADEPLVRQTGSGPGAPATYYHHDGLGSAIAATDAAGTITGTQRFDAWGNNGSATGIIAQYGYTGREPDGTGLIYYRARYYDPTIGRFLQKDPIGLRGGLNLYAYVGNNPINLIDPFGLTPKIVLADAVSAISYFGGTQNDAGNQTLGSALKDTGKAVWNAAVGTVEATANIIGGGALPGFSDYVPFLDKARAQYDTPVFGTTVEVLTGLGAIKALGSVGQLEQAQKGGAGLTSTSQLPNGSFSIIDWSRYPTVGNVPQPAGPFRLLEGAEYDAARSSANAANRAIHQADPSLAGQQIHEVQPVKFGGNPTDPANKIPLSPTEHAPYTNWWNQLLRNLTW